MDAAALMARFGAAAYSVARERDRAERHVTVIDGDRRAGHWGLVRLRIARENGEEARLDTGMRYLLNDATWPPTLVPGPPDGGCASIPARFRRASPPMTHVSFEAESGCFQRIP